MNTTRCFRLIGSLVLGAQLATAVIPAAAADDAPAAESRPRLGKVVIFPFESTNIDPRTTRAFTEIFGSALRARGINVLDWRGAYEELYGALDTPARELAAPAANHHQHPVTTPSAAFVHTSPPTPGGAAPPAYPQQYYTAPQVFYVQQPAAPVPPQPVHAEPELRAAAKRAVAAKAGAESYIEGSLTRLGHQIRVTVLVKDLKGVEIGNQVMDARTDHDLSNVLERIASAMAEGRSAAATLALDNATIHETQKMPERYRLETHLGVALGQVFSVSEHMEHLTLISFDARFEMRNLLVGLNAGLVFAPGRHSSDDYDVGLLAGISLASYLSQTPIAPYLGAGAGVFFGKMMNSDDDERKRDSSIGFHASPLMGLEFMRHTRIRVHVEFRWMLVFDPSERRFGHGPMPLIGINF